jgi:hypothetical protein
VLYTDGLVESRDRDVDEGLRRLEHALSGAVLSAGGTHVGGSSRDRSRSPAAVAPDAPASLETVCDTVLASMFPDPADRPADDVALLIARTRALAADRVASWEIAADPALVALARARASAQLVAWGLADAVAITELLVSELVTNAIRHGRPPIQLRLVLGTALTCEVSDGSSAAPHLRRARAFDEGGRGLLLVAHLAARWGTRQTPTGKIIWAEQPVS